MDLEEPSPPTLLGADTTLLLTALALTGWLLWKDLESRQYWRRLGVEYEAACPLRRPRALLRSLTPGLPQLRRLYSSSAAPILGFFKGRTPVLMIRDPALVVAVMQADFQHFTDKRHPIQLDKSEDPLSQHLIGLTGEKWKTIRSKLTPVFSSGKIKESLPLIEEAVDDILPQLGAESVDIYPLAVTLVTDVILSYAFGLSREDPNRGLVRRMGLRSVRANYQTALKRAIRFCFPKLFRLLRLRAFEPDVTSFFVEFVKHAIMKIQASSHIGRADFISRLGNVAAVVPEEERDGVVAAQVFSFYVAGFETTCFALSTSIYELSKNPTVLMKARKELDGLLKKHGSFSYEALQEATYLTQIIQESMRMYPADYATPRICTKPYRIPGTNIVLEKGTEVLIPGFCLSRDPKYHEDPLKFDPERFSKDNKTNIIPGTYLPFGDGPRKCIAVRFSMLELKYVLARLIASYDLQLDPTTPQELTFDENSRVTHYCGRILVRFDKRKDLLSEIAL